MHFFLETSILTHLQVQVQTTSSSRPRRKVSSADNSCDCLTPAPGQKGQKSGPKQANAEKAAASLANGVNALSVDESSRAKSKNLDVLAEYEKTKAKGNANFVVIGALNRCSRIGY